MTDFRIRAFGQRIIYDANDYVVSGVNTIEEAAKKLSLLQVKAQGTNRRIPLTEADGITRVGLDDRAVSVIDLVKTEAVTEFGFLQVDENGSTVRNLTEVLPILDTFAVQESTRIGEPLDIEWPDASEFESIMEEDEPDE